MFQSNEIGASLLLGKFAGEANDPPSRLFEARLRGSQRDAQVTYRTRPEAVARKQGDVFAREQGAREILRTETGPADVEQHEHAAFGRDNAAIRGLGEKVRQ